MRPWHTRRLPAAMLAAAVAACSSAPHGGLQTSPQPVGGGRSSSAAIAQARADSVRNPYTTADVYFMSGMISHHAQALLMAGWAPSHGASAAVQTLCARIVNGQKDEIATMQTWLADRRQPVPEARPTGMKMMMGGVEHTMLMPGMLTAGQLEQLDQARGTEFDRLFLTFMIQHHRGALSMVKDLFASNGAGQDEVVFKLASGINVDQETEIARMERMLIASLPASSTP